MRVNFTKRAIEAIPPPKTGTARYLDEKVRGLGLLVQSTGHKSFYWFRKVHGFPRRETLGRFGDLTVENARDAAENLNNKFSVWKANRYPEGENPFTPRREVPTLDETVDLYVEGQIKRHAKRPDRAEKDFRSVIKRRAAALRNRRLGDISQEDVEDIHRRIGEKEGHKRAANVFVKSMRILYSFAEKKKLYKGANPSKGFKLYAETKRARYLQPAELPQFFTALKKAPNPDLRDFVNLSLWTGARKGDVLSMRWQDLDLSGGNSWTIPDPKNQTPYTVPLDDEAIKILKDRLRGRVGDSPWVFPAKRKTSTGHVVDLNKRWREFRKAAKLDGADLRIHDLRRTNASWKAIQGTSLITIGRSLGHAAGSAATAVYGRMDLEPVRAATESANAAIRAAGKKKPKLLVAAPTKRKEAARG